MITLRTTESTFNDLSLMALAVERKIKWHRAAGDAALVALLEALLNQINLTREAALEAAKGNNHV